MRIGPLGQSSPSETLPFVYESEGSEAGSPLRAHAVTNSEREGVLAYPSLHAKQFESALIQ